MSDYTELVKALRHCGKDLMPGERCKDSCPYGDIALCLPKLKLDAAAAIEDLQRELSDAEIAADDMYRIACEKQSNIEELQAEVQELKRVNLEIFDDLPKLGEWIRVQEVDIPGEMHPTAFKCMCSMCRNEYLFPRIPQYCPDCGSMNTAKMEVQE